MRTNLALISLVIAVACGLSGCCGHDGIAASPTNATPAVLQIAGKDFQSMGDELTQITRDSDSDARLGVIADAHGYDGLVSAFSREFAKEGVDGIVMLGDSAQHFRTKPNVSRSDYDEIHNCVEAAAQTGLAVYVIPGNHDMSADYEKALAALAGKYPNVIDMAKTRIVDGDDFNLVSEPYGTDFTYGDGSYQIQNTADDLERVLKRLPKDGEVSLLVSHQPTACSGRYGTDVAYDGTHVGRDDMSRLLNVAGVRFELAGHIHESGGVGVTEDCQPVASGVPVSSLKFNPGAASPWTLRDGTRVEGMAGIVTFHNQSGEYQVLRFH